MERIFICSPYRGDETANTFNAREYCKHAIEQGYLPIAPHLYFTQFFDETVDAERNTGISMGLELMSGCKEVWAFYNPEVGPSEGMRLEMANADYLGLIVKELDPETYEPHPLFQPARLQPHFGQALEPATFTFDSPAELEPASFEVE